MEYVIDEEGFRYYVADFGGSGGMTIVHLPVADVEAVVAQHTSIQPVFEGGSVYLQFGSPGDGFAKEHEEFDTHFTLSDMVGTFLADSWLSPDEYRNALRDLDLALKAASKRVSKAVRDGHLPKGVIEAFEAKMEAEAADAVASAHGPTASS